MSDLDKKLEDILHRSYMHKHLVGIDALYTSAAIIPHVNDEVAVEQIKQAFIDAGWVDTKKPVGSDIHGVGVYYAKEAGKKLFAVNRQDELVMHDGTKVHFNPEDDRMSGQEWYDRFKEEAPFPRSPLSVNVAYLDMMAAAKKASGIE